MTGGARRGCGMSAFVVLCACGAAVVPAAPDVAAMDAVVVEAGGMDAAETAAFDSTPRMDAPVDVALRISDGAFLADVRFLPDGFQEFCAPYDPGSDVDAGWAGFPAPCSTGFECATRAGLLMSIHGQTGPGIPPPWAIDGLDGSRGPRSSMPVPGLYGRMEYWDSPSRSHRLAQRVAVESGGDGVARYQAATDSTDTFTDHIHWSAGDTSSVRGVVTVVDGTTHFSVECGVDVNWNGHTGHHYCGGFVSEPLADGVATWTCDGFEIRTATGRRLWFDRLQ